MGADGSIQIYDYDKLLTKYDQEFIDSFTGHFLSSTFYLQEMQGKKYLTRYMGDNLAYATDLWDVVSGAYDVEKGNFEANKNSWSYSSCEAEYFMKSFNKSMRKAYLDLIMFLESDCRLAQWEVWT